MSEPWVPLSDWTEPALPGETWDAYRARWRAAMEGRIPTAQPTVRVRMHHMGKYDPTLARFPNDPQAYVASEYSRQKLVDQRLREGWRDMGRPGDQKLTGKPDGAKDPIEEAIRKAREGKVDDVGPR